MAMLEPLKPKKEISTLSVTILFTLLFFLVFFLSLLINSIVLGMLSIFFTIPIVISRAIVSDYNNEVRKLNERINDPCWRQIQSEEELKEAYIKYPNFEKNYHMNDIYEFNNDSSYNYKEDMPFGEYCSWWHWMMESKASFWYHDDERRKRMDEEIAKSNLEKNNAMLMKC